MLQLWAKNSPVTDAAEDSEVSRPSLSCLLCFFMHVGHPYIPLFKIRRNFDLLVSPPFLVLFRQVVYIYNLSPCPHCSSTKRFVTKKLIILWPVLSVCILLSLHIEHHYCDDCIHAIRVRS